MKLKLKQVKESALSFLKTYKAIYKTENGKELEYEFVSRQGNISEQTMSGRKTDAVVILPFSEDYKRVLMIKEFRLPVNETVIEFPAGLIDAGETAEEAAIRELKEETGYSVLKVVHVSKPSYTSSGLTNEKIQYVHVIVDDSGVSKPKLEETESIDLIWVAKEDAMKVAEGGAPMDSKAQVILKSFASKDLHKI